MFNSIVAEAIYLVRGGMTNGFFMQVVEGLTTSGPERVEILFALVLIGTMLGAGSWVGWELVKIVAEFTEKTFKLIKNGPVDRHFKRPARPEKTRNQSAL